MEAKVAGWTRYYKGEITRVNSDGTYDIRFDDGERKRGVRDDQIKGNDDRMRDDRLHHLPVKADEKVTEWKQKLLVGRATTRARSPVSIVMEHTTFDLMMASASVACVMIKSRATMIGSSSPSSSSRQSRRGRRSCGSQGCWLDALLQG